MSAERWGRWYFAVQALAGAAWWVSVFLVPPVGAATLGSLDPVVTAVLDVPLFVVASALAAFGIRWAAILATAWTLLVTVSLGIFAAVTQEAGIGALLMVGAAVGSVTALALLLTGGIPRAWITIGPFAFHPADATASTGSQLRRTAVEIIVFWGVFLAVIPAVLRFFELRWQVAIALPPGAEQIADVAGVIVSVLGSVVGLWSAAAMATTGGGTPLPAAMPNRLVIAGPYRFVRNPMAVGSIVQGVGVGLLLSSWVVVVYAVFGAVVWNVLVRPVEEADLEARFGEPYRRYREDLRCWVPSLRPVSARS
ncbi:isoprenylcysteine carboxylmethyltransferase family protein [Plantibacter sp. ME-Dv--P-122b]|uniref:methyltransferase family protein n=1 Tax=Plantibacter sp. ME-Dv--P-122b TaxID=3040300 RepID=UPI00254A2103|nr:isoprenylcysteine carboxylmethyltransferase family protein [Plantibacter sp. ME-Dv--P-122b]